MIFTSGPQRYRRQSWVVRSRTTLTSPPDGRAPSIASSIRDLAHDVTFIPGDGTGPELAEATRRVLEGTGVAFEWDEHPAGEDVYAEEGTPFPERTLDSIKKNKVGIKGPTTTPVGS